MMVDVASEEDLREAVESALDALGLSFSELRAQALHRNFSSDAAKRTWVAIAGLGYLAPK